MKVNKLIATSLILIGLTLGGCTQVPVEPQASEPAEPSIQPADQNGEWSTFTLTVSDNYERTTLEEIPSLVGLDMPIPTYLPSGWDIEAYIGEVRYGESARMLLIISDGDIKHTDSEVECIMVIAIARPCPLGGLKHTTRWHDEGKHYIVSVWQSGPPGYEAWSYVAEDIDREIGEELVKIKQSMP